MVVVVVVIVVHSSIGFQCSTVPLSQCAPAAWWSVAAVWRQSSRSPYSAWWLGCRRHSVAPKSEKCLLPSTARYGQCHHKESNRSFHISFFFVKATPSKFVFLIYFIFKKECGEDFFGLSTALRAEGGEGRGCSLAGKGKKVWPHKIRILPLIGLGVEKELYSSSSVSGASFHFLSWSVVFKKAVHFLNRQTDNESNSRFKWGANFFHFFVVFTLKTKQFIQAAFRESPGSVETALCRFVRLSVYSLPCVQKKHTSQKQIDPKQFTHKGELAKGEFHF